MVLTVNFFKSIDRSFRLYGSRELLLCCDDRYNRSLMIDKYMFDRDYMYPYSSSNVTNYNIKWRRRN